VNWFRKDANGKFLWPGFGENLRVLNWIFERIEGTGKAVYSPFGNIPTEDAINLTELNLSEETKKELFFVDKSAGLNEAERIREYFTSLGERLPTELIEELDAFKERFVKL
jgi:phosphoenolpyruvate carboxykinase (GTP)